MEADREIERLEARDRDREEDRNFHERPVVAQPLDRLLGARDIVAGLDKRDDEAPPDGLAGLTDIALLETVTTGALHRVVKLDPLRDVVGMGDVGEGPSAQLFGVSFALGAFFAGMVLRESEFSHRAAEETVPLRDAFAVLFFVSVGMLLNPTALLDEIWLVAAALAVAASSSTDTEELEDLAGADRLADAIRD